ncbi:MAG TPA: hypothetical protein VNO70_24915 [Blastocatellia bacterium]|nr:hypothetical protein [Blastocatellia bacterium]
MNLGLNGGGLSEERIATKRHKMRKRFSTALSPAGGMIERASLHFRFVIFVPYCG